MKKIIIKEISFLNFKGFKSQKIEFNENLTSICGRNGLGKTTIFDGFTWLLFGKDSQDRKTFTLKTLDAEGVAIQRLPHEVSAILIVDGAEIELCRRFNEKWVKRRGQAEEEFTGHEEERLYNNVPLSLKEWNEKISAICTEQVFKFITSPSYFVSQKPDVQRQMLFRMAGELSDKDIAAGNADFTALLASITGKSMEEYKKEIQARKRRIKAETDAIPERIDERKRDIATLEAGEDFNAVEKALAEKQKELEDVKTAILDRSKEREAQVKAREELVKKLGKLKEERLTLEFQIKENVMADYRKAVADKNELSGKVKHLEKVIENAEKEVKAYESKIADCNAVRERLIAEWKAIKAETISFNEADFTCPTCGRRFEVGEIESKQQELTENFNANKSARLQANECKGKENKARIEEYNGTIAEYQTEIVNAQLKLDEVKMSGLLDTELVAPDAQPEIEANAEWKKIDENITLVSQQIENSSETSSDTDTLTDKQNELTKEIDGYKQTLSYRETIKRNKERIAELEAQMKQGAQEIADLEREEFTIAEFAKARVSAIESRINGMFKIVKFRMFEQQINGGEVETCEATVGGVPYSVLNNAGRINAGLDIINAICAHEGITAPIFCDNAESVNNLLPTQSQMIRLVVSEDNKLTIK